VKQRQFGCQGDVGRLPDPSAGSPGTRRSPVKGSTTSSLTSGPCSRGKRVLDYAEAIGIANVGQNESGKVTIPVVALHG
jgi:hypothetical protein